MKDKYDHTCIIVSRMFQEYLIASCLCSFLSTMCDMKEVVLLLFESLASCLGYFDGWCIASK